MLTSYHLAGYWTTSLWFAKFDNFSDSDGNFYEAVENHNVGKYQLLKV